MATQTSTIRISVDGDWDIEDLKDLSESLAETYGLLYPLVAQDEVVRERLQDSIRQTFWAGDTDMRYVGERLYRQIPKDEGLKLKSFHYSSLGHLELLGSLAVLLLMARVALAWLKVGDGFLSLWRKVEKYFDARKHLKKPKKNFELDTNLSIDSDEARSLVFDIGVTFGFTHASCETLIAAVGNPIATLKFLVALGKEGRKVSNLQSAGKIMLPAPPTEEIVLQASATTRKRKGDIEVVIKPPRRGPKR